MLSSLMRIEESRQHHIAWIPWVLALVALLGVDAVGKQTSQGRLNDTADELGMSVCAKAGGTTGRAADPVVLGAPVPLIDTAILNPECTFLKLQTAENLIQESQRQGWVRGRAPPGGA